MVHTLQKKETSSHTRSFWNASSGHLDHHHHQEVLQLSNTDIVGWKLNYKLIELVKNQFGLFLQSVKLDKDYIVESPQCNQTGIMALLPLKYFYVTIETHIMEW